jgi:hypothetical protein
MTTIVEVGEDVRVNASTAYRAESPHIARFTDGSVKNVTPVNAGAAKLVLNAKTVLLSDGGWAVVWSVNNGALKQGDLYMQRFSADGTRLYASDRPVNVTTDGHQEEFDLIALSNGGWAVTWSSYKDGAPDVYQQVFSSSGSPLQSSDILVNRTTVNSQSGSQITALKGGGYVISWISFGSDGAADVYQQR